VIHQNIEGLQEECDRMIARFISMNFDITDTENEHSKMVFILRRKNRVLEALSSTRAIKSCKVRLDDVFPLVEHLQDLYEACREAVNRSNRYQVTEDWEDVPADNNAV